MVEIRYFYTLAGLRGVAAMAVLWFHTAPFLGSQMVPFGYAAVDLFFLLSGVVIETSYGDKLRAGMPVASFFKARFVRIYPLYAVSVLFMLFDILVSSGQGLFVNATALRLPIQHFSQICVMAFLGLPIWNVMDMYPLNQPAWSLFFELSANALWVAMLPSLSTRRLQGLIVLSFAGIIANHYYPTGNHLLDGFSRAGFSFFLGVLMARQPQRHWRRSGAAGLIIAAAILMLGLRAPPFMPPFFLWLVFVVVGFPCLVWGGMAVQPGRALRIFCQVSGNISYPVYLLHWPLTIFCFDILAPKLHVNAADYAPWSGLGLMLGICAAGWATDRYFDTPLRHRLMWSLRRPG